MCSAQFIFCAFALANILEKHCDAALEWKNAHFEDTVALGPQQGHFVKHASATVLHGLGDRGMER